MKWILAVVLVVSLSGIAIAEPLTDAELAKVRTILENTDSEKLPLKLLQLRKERDAIIAERDAKLTAESVKYQSAKTKVENDYEVLIDAKESEINAKEQELEGITIN